MTTSFVQKGEQCGLRFDGNDEVISNLYVALKWMKGKTITELDLLCFDDQGGHLIVGISPFSREDIGSIMDAPRIYATQPDEAP